MSQSLGLFEAGTGGLAGVNWTARWDRRYKLGSRRAVLCFPGVSGTADYFFNPTNPVFPYVEKLLEGGYPLFSMDVGTLYGNATARARISALLTLVTTTRGYAKAGPAHILAHSMGSAYGFLHAKNTPSEVKSMYLSLPAIDPEDIRANDRLSQAANINAALGNPVPDADRPSLQTAILRGTPQTVAYGGADTVCLPGFVAPYAAATRAEVVDLGASIGHDLSTMPPRGPVDFFNRYDN